MRFDLPEGFFLSSIVDGDQPAYLQHFRDKSLTDALLLIPYPYTQHDADDWVNSNVTTTREELPESHFGIRRPDGFLIGGCGLVLEKGFDHYRSELGYWIATDYRRLGLTRAATRAVIQHGFSALGLKRIQAWAEISNVGSQRILETVGFTREGLIKGYHQKHGVLLDCYLYDLLRIAPNNALPLATSPPY